MKLGPFFVFATFALAAGLGIRFAMDKVNVYGPIVGHTEPLKEPVPAYLRSLHPKYPYSIIPGGVYSATDLRNADREDPVVKEHYADFNMKQVQMVQLADDRYQYVSYRQHQRIYWTKKKLRIPKGELLLTDGSTWARARCGNRLSEHPRTPVRSEDPPAKLLSMPAMKLGTPMELAETPAFGDVGNLAAAAPVNPEEFSPVLPQSTATPTELAPLVPAAPVLPIIPVATVLFPPPGSIPTVSTPTSPVVVPPGAPIIPPTGAAPVTTVPEPQAIYLFLVTFVISLYGLTKMMSRNDNNKTEGIEK